MTTIAQKQARLKELDTLISALWKEQDALEAELHNSTAEIRDILLESNISVDSYLRMLLNQLVRRGYEFDPKAPFGDRVWWAKLVNPVAIAKGIGAGEAASLIGEYVLQGFCEVELPC